MNRALFALLVAVCVSAASAATYKITLIEPVTLNGQNLKPGDYPLNVNESGAVLGKGKQKLDLPAKLEDAHQKFERTQVLYREANGAFAIQEIDLGGTTTKLTFAQKP